MSASQKPSGLRAGVLDQSGWSAETVRKNPHLTGRSVRMSDGALTIALPLPAAELSPNARCHWAKKAGAVKAYRLRAEVECGTHSERHQAATVRIQWYTKTKMHPDPMNCTGSLKPAMDGVTDSGYLADDRELYPSSIEFQKDASNPRVVLTFTPKPND